MFSGIQLRFHKRYILGCGGLIDGIQEGLEIRSSDLADALFSLFTDDLEIILMPFVVCQCL